MCLYLSLSRCLALYLSLSLAVSLWLPLPLSVSRWLSLPLSVCVSVGSYGGGVTHQRGSPVVLCRAEVRNEGRGVRESGIEIRLAKFQTCETWQLCKCANENCTLE